jgi:biotin transport system ATP-binding protein
MIETRNLTHRYRKVTALDSVSLTIPNNQFILIVGPNGSGKTTLVRHFNGLLDPDSGDVLVDGQPVQDDLVAARTAVGMVFQDPRDQLVAATVGADVMFGPENLGLSREEIDRRVEDALEAVGMTGRGDEPISELSGGERERVAIAGTLAMEPAHLVLDEPFTGLDLPARQSVMNHLEMLSTKGTGIVMVTHNPRRVLDLADRVVAIADGEVALDASPVEARKQLTELDVSDS